MTNRNAAVAPILSTLLLFAIAPAYATDLAKVNGATITLEDFNRKFDEVTKFYQVKAQSKQGMLDDLIKRELGVQEARRLGLDKDPEVQERMNTVLYHALLDRQLSKQFEGINVTEQEAKRYYSKYPELRTSHIFISLRPDADAESDRAAQAKMKKISDGLKQGTSFAEMAQRFSEGTAAPMGGDLDFQGKDKLDPVYYQTALKLGAPGKTSGIIRTQFGYHIIRLTAVRPWEEVDKAQVKRLVFEERRAEIFENYMAGLRKKAKVSIQPGLLK
ncbi:MAG: hypothetical protein A2X94_09330 [Bdellovibrionales bacterium GWB1_55_8]|nr:MAG: hypothetical protein A2X94_09330 [Bdellovibrionales bacterium GWB1_55_8]